MPSEWFYDVNGQRKGPISTQEFKTLARGGRIDRETLVWKEGLTDWVRAKQVKGIFKDPPPLPQQASKGPPPLPQARPQPPPLPAGRDAPSTAHQDIPPHANQPKAAKPPSALAPVTCLIAGNALAALCLVATAKGSAEATVLLALLTIAVWVGCLAVEAIFIHRAWSFLPDPYRTISPGKAVGLMFIPFFNLFWVFYAVHELTKQMNAYLKDRGIKVLIAESTSLGACLLFIASFVLGLAGILVPGMAKFSGFASAGASLFIGWWYMEFAKAAVSQDGPREPFPNANLAKAALLVTSMLLVLATRYGAAAGARSATWPVVPMQPGTGAGTYPPAQPAACFHCRGTGTQATACLHCGATGTVMGYTCQHCGGRRKPPCGYCGGTGIAP